MQLDFFPSRTLTLYLAKLFVVRILAVLVMLVIVYRSPLLPVLVLLTSVAALCGGILAVYFLAERGLIALSGQTQGIMSIIVIGAATDYGLLYTARFREALHTTPSRWTATRIAWKGTTRAERNQPPSSTSSPST